MDSRFADQEAGTGAGRTPALDLDGFSGTLARLLSLARAGGVELARLSLPALLEQLAAALAQAAPLAEKADWLVMAAWLLHLRSNLLLPADAPAHAAAAGEADRLRRRLATLRDVQACAAWLDRRPYLGHDVFPCGQPDLSAGVSAGIGHAVDVIEFLWACLDLFDDDSDAAGAAEIYRPHRPALHSVAEATARILAMLAEAAAPQPLARLLPAPRDDGDDGAGLRRRSAWSSTFVASLELARQGAVALAQDGAFAPIRVSRPA